jgi:glutathione S-transferase
MEDVMQGSEGESINIHTFPAGFGLPTTGPFSLKLAMALRLAGIRYSLVAGTDLTKSPKRKIPWIDVGGRSIADSALILSWLRDTRGVDLERGLSPLQRAQGLALRALLEEHWHQVFEIELILDPEGAGPHLGAAMQEHFRKHLYERGMLRHTRDEIIALGREDLDATAAWLDARGGAWAITDEPTLTDCTIWGLLAPAVYAPFPTPCMSYARTLAPIVRFIERARDRCFPEVPVSGPAAKLGLGPS